MRKRWVNDNSLRTIISARLRKGSAFMSDATRGCTYEEEKRRVDEMLEPMSRAELFNRFAHLTYDLKQ